MECKSYFNFYSAFNFLSDDDKHHLTTLTLGLLNCNPTERLSALKALDNPLFKDYNINLKLASFDDNINSIWSSYNIIDYFSSQLTPHMRLILYDWLFAVGCSFRLKYDTIFHSYILCDAYLSKSNKKFSKDKYQLLGITCLYISSKLLESSIPSSDEFVNMTASAYTLDEFLKMEYTILINI